VRNLYLSKDSLKHTKDVVYLQAIQNTKCVDYMQAQQIQVFEYAFLSLVA